MAETIKDAFAQRQAQSQGQINQTFDSTLNTQKQGLQDAFNQNMGLQQQQGQDIQKAYTTASQDWQTQEARNRRGMDSFAEARGLNYQPGSQQALQLNRARQSGLGKIEQQRAVALQENQRQIELTKTNYQNQVQRALADNDYKRAAALLDDYNNQNNWLEKNAAALAAYGEFGGFGLLYGDDTAKGMKNNWVAQNPDLAYNTGAIDAERYRQMTGQYPPGYTPPSSGGGWGGSGGINADYYINGRPVWTQEHGGVGYSTSGSGSGLSAKNNR